MKQWYQRRVLGVEAVVSTQSTQKFTGLAGHTQVAKRRWTVPAGLFGRAATVSFYEIDGAMHGLFARDDMTRLQMNLFMRHDGTWCDFESLDVYGSMLPSFPNGHAAINLLEFNETSMQDTLFSDFRCQKSECITYLACDVPLDARAACFLTELDVEMDRRDLFVAEALAEKRTMAMPARVTRQISRMRTRHQTLFDALQDNGKTFCWELFAGASELSKMATRAGHRVGVPLDILRGVDLKKPSMASAVKWMVMYFKPWLVAMGFPCTPYSAWQRVNRIQYGTDTDALMEQNEPLVNLSCDVAEIQCRAGRLALLENPWPAGGWDHHRKLIRLRELGLMVLVVGDQCEFDHVAADGSDAYHRKTTGFMVPKGSSLEFFLILRCSGEHWHLQLRGSLTTKASRWPEGLCSCMMAGGTRDLAEVSWALHAVCVEAKLDAKALRTVADELYLRHEVCVLEPLCWSKSGQVSVDVRKASNFCRRIVVTYNEEGCLAGYTDHMKEEQGYRDAKLPYELRDSDVSLVLWIHETGDFCYPSVRPEFTFAFAGAQAPWVPTVVDEIPDHVMEEIYADADDDLPEAKRVRHREPAPEVPMPPSAPAAGDAPAHDLHDMATQGRDSADGYGPKPEGLTVVQWGALKKLHQNLGHAPGRTMKRMLRTLGSQQTHCGRC